MAARVTTDPDTAITVWPRSVEPGLRVAGAVPERVTKALLVVAVFTVTEAVVGTLWISTPTSSVRVNVPVSSCGSIVVPDAIYVPEDKVPLVVTSPLPLTSNSGLPLDWT